MSAQVALHPGETHQGLSLDVQAQGPAAPSSSEEAGAQGAEHTAVFLSDYLDSVGEGCAGLPPMPPEQATLAAAPAQQAAQLPVLGTREAACSGGVLHPTPATMSAHCNPLFAQQRAFDALVAAPLRSAYAQSGLPTSSVAVVGVDGTVTCTFGAVPTADCAGQQAGMPGGTAGVVGHPLAQQANGPQQGEAAPQQGEAAPAVAAQPNMPLAVQRPGSAGQPGSSQQVAQPCAAAAAVRHRLRGVEEAPLGSGNFKLFVKVFPAVRLPCSTLLAMWLTLCFASL